MGDGEYPSGNERRYPVVLPLLGIVAAALFIATTVVVRFYHEQEKTLAQGWFRRGESALSAGRADDAVLDLRNALAYSPATMYQLRLAQALVAAGRHDEARGYLLTLWERQPGNSRVNLLLARLAAGSGAASRAEGYYHNAIYGVWQDEDPETARRNVRIELANLLLAQGEMQAADSDLVALSANLPPDAAMHARVAGLLLRAGDVSRAMDEYRRALQINPTYGPALAGAGEVAYTTGDYASAQEYLQRALRADPQNTQAARMLSTSELVLRIDPFAPRLGTVERSRRASQAFHQALARVRDCAAKTGVSLGVGLATSELQSVYDRAQPLQPVTPVALQREPDAIYSAMDWVTAAETAANRACGEPQGLDLALVLIGKRKR